uniref:Partial AB-hydrolase lipase domain-containing protein n=1 Tax=Timema genevievae TaxID=629358 RepID=A0A7R9K6R6_TIMGE|nr:unnamed protein product [Timema genevievae]
MRLQYGPCFLLIFIAISHAKLLSTQNLVNIFEMIAAVKVPEAFLTAPEIIELHGYPVETHRIVTEDGYILTLHRIPGSRLSPPRPGKKPVLLQHGVLSCSVDWIITPSGLGYLLADAGYDVWMGNSRGNTYSSSHVELSLEDPEFWQFSWHEMGIYDLPATIDYVLEQTAQRKLYYIGHSMGNTMFYVLCSMRPEYNAKIRAQFSLAPVAFVEHIYSNYQMVALFSLNMNTNIRTFYSPFHLLQLTTTHSDSSPIPYSSLPLLQLHTAHRDSSPNLLFPLSLTPAPHRSPRLFAEPPIPPFPYFSYAPLTATLRRAPIPPYLYSSSAPLTETLHRAPSLHPHFIPLFKELCPSSPNLPAPDGLHPTFRAEKEGPFQRTSPTRNRY